MISPEEKEVLDYLVAAHNAYVKLSKQHPSDLPEWILAHHQLSSLIALRVARRAAPEIFLTIEDVKV